MRFLFAESSPSPIILEVILYLDGKLWSLIFFANRFYPTLFYSMQSLILNSYVILTSVLFITLENDLFGPWDFLELVYEVVFKIAMF